MADSTDTTSPSLSRRTLLTATAALAAPVPAAAATDPTLPLFAQYMREAKAIDRLADEPQTVPEALADAMERRLIAAERRLKGTLKRLLATRPTTLPGLAAKATCIRDRLDCPDDRHMLDVVIGDLQHFGAATA